LALNVGPQLRAIRMSQGRSLRSVAAGVGISPSLLSQVENSKTSPSVSTLYALVSHLGVTLDALSVPAELGKGLDTKRKARSNAVVQRRSDNQKLVMQNGVIWERLADKASRLVDPLLVTYEPGAGSSLDSQEMHHNAAEFGLLLEGELTLILGGKSYRISAGDSFSFDANKPHRYENNGTATARGVWFVVSKSEDLKPTATKATKKSRQPDSAVEVLALMDHLRK
jgi:transcriptional regulator with XRE-family HTH domain